MTRTDSPAYRASYNRGWAYSRRDGSLDRADAKGYTWDDAWMDGFMDDASGRDKWHLLRCAGCVEHPDRYPVS